jgi:hypothetical protein
VFEVKPLFRNTVSISGAASPVPVVAVDDELDDDEALDGADPCVLMKY